MRVNNQGEIGYTALELSESLRVDPTLDLTEVKLLDPDQHNQACQQTHSELSEFAQWDPHASPPPGWHQAQQSHWHIPEFYQNLDVERLLEQTAESDSELARIQLELSEFKKRDLLPMLRYLCFLAQTARENHITLGVGRGSSVASFCLYKLGIHRINSLEWNLDISEFLK